MTEIWHNPLILVPGWAGDLTPEEVAYIRAELEKSPALRRRWGLSASRITEAGVRRVAMEGAGQPPKSPRTRHFAPKRGLKKNGGQHGRT